MIVNFPEDAAETIWLSIDLLILAVSDCIQSQHHSLQGSKGSRKERTFFIAACFNRTVFFGAICRWPLFVLAAARAAWREEATLLCNPLVFPFSDNYALV